MNQLRGLYYTTIYKPWLGSMSAVIVYFGASANIIPITTLPKGSVVRMCLWAILSFAAGFGERIYIRPRYEAGRPDWLVDQREVMSGSMRVASDHCENRLQQPITLLNQRLRSIRQPKCVSLPKIGLFKKLAFNDHDPLTYATSARIAEETTEH
jgi:hypothetical protein